MSRFTLFITLMLLLLFTGCERRSPATTSALQQETSDYVLLVAVDLSGSFLDFLTADGRAHEFLLQTIDQYHRAGIGGDFQIIITQLSGNRRPLLWQGTPRQLRQDFVDPDAFRQFLQSHADPDASRLNDGIAESLDYALHTYSVAKGKAKAVALILSDMNETFDPGPESDARLVDALTRFAHRGEVGFYYCDQQRMAVVRDMMQQADISMYHLECDIHGRPPLPSFD